MYTNNKTKSYTKINELKTLLRNVAFAVTDTATWLLFGEYKNFY